jgi:hypothetical protein
MTLLTQSIAAAGLALPALLVLDPGDGSMGDLEVEASIDRDQALGLGVDSVDGQVGVPVVGKGDGTGGSRRRGCACGDDVPGRKPAPVRSSTGKSGTWKEAASGS